MAKNATHNIKHVWVLIGLGVVVIIVLYAIINSSKSFRKTTPEVVSSITPIATVTPDISKPRIYHLANTTFTVPVGFTTEHYHGGVLLKNSQGKIDVGIGATNATSLNSAVSEAENRLPSDEQLDRRHVTINGQPSIMVVATSPSRPQLPQLNHKIYYFYVEQWQVLDMSTNSQTLYPVLDQVAQSFRYTP